MRACVRACVRVRGTDFMYLCARGSDLIYLCVKGSDLMYLCVRSSDSCICVLGVLIHVFVC